MLISRDIRECGVSYGRVDVIGHCGKIRVFYKCKKKKRSSRAVYVVMAVMLNGLN